MLPRLNRFAPFLVLACLACRLGRAEGPAPASAAIDRLLDMKLLFTFQGKGSSLTYDAGVVQRAFEVLPALADRKVIVGGNSSGSVFAVYFSGFGFTPASVAYAEHRIQRADMTAIRRNEVVINKVANLLQNKPVEVPHSVLKEYIAVALGVQDWQSARDINEVARRSRWRPVYPVVIAAANAEVLENRGTEWALAADNYKEFDPTDFSVYWKPDVYEFYKRHPQRFAKDHPHLRLGPDRYIGKACTCFVDPTMYALLSRIPARERLCDLRLMTTPADAALAIQASVSEPSYFVPIAETDHGKLAVDDRLGFAGNSRRRSYCGGFIMPLVGQDVRRMLPHLSIVGTGTARIPLAARQLVEAWFLVDVEQVAQLCEWWADVMMTIPREVKAEMITRQVSVKTEVLRGYERAAEGFATGNALPRYINTPKYTWPAEAALLPLGAEIEFVEPQSPGEPPKLKTLRGVEPLLKK